MLRKVIIQPREIINTLAGIFLVIKAAIGAAKLPPIINPIITLQLNCDSKAKNATTSEIVTKNSAAFTEPIVFLGFFPSETNVDVTIGPHPPPPMASKKPPKRPKIE